MIRIYKFGGRNAILNHGSPSVTAQHAPCHHRPVPTTARSNLFRSWTSFSGEFLLSESKSWNKYQ